LRAPDALRDRQLGELSVERPNLLDRDLLTRLGIEDVGIFLRGVDVNRLGEPLGLDELDVVEVRFGGGLGDELVRDGRSSFLERGDARELDLVADSGRAFR
jgi:hypothetical protein